jgi:TetR/AcrR family transcriptional repressor of nem operon
MHSGIFRTLVDVLGFYEDVDSLGGERARNPNVSREELDPLVRELRDVDGEDVDLIEFLRALSDDSFDRTIPERARKLRAEGLNGPGVASLMKASGLTVGGFYKHFRSKDELFAEAIAQAFSDSDKVYSSLQDAPREDRWKEVVRLYLSPEHCDHPDTGCPVAALAPEIARAKFTVRKRISGLMKQRTARWVEFMPGQTTSEREQNFFIIFSAMAGAVSIARLWVLCSGS